jgi:hypothetical protein
LAILTLAATPAAIWKRFLKQVYLVTNSFFKILNTLYDYYYLKKFLFADLAFF